MPKQCGNCWKLAGNRSSLICICCNLVSRWFRHELLSQTFHGCYRNKVLDRLLRQPLVDLATRKQLVANNGHIKKIWIFFFASSRVLLLDVNNWFTCDLKKRNAKKSLLLSWTKKPLYPTFPPSKKPAKRPLQSWFFVFSEMDYVRAAFRSFNDIAVRCNVDGFPTISNPLIYAQLKKSLSDRKKSVETSVIACFLYRNVV